MKKILMSFVIVIMMFIVTGCGTKTLSCKMSKEQSGMTLNQNMEATFVNNEVTKMNTQIDVKLSATYTKNIDLIKKTLESQYKKYEDNGGKVTVTSKDNIIKVNMDFDLKKMTDEEKSKLNMIDTKGSKKSTAESLEKQGYTCK